MSPLLAQLSAVRRNRHAVTALEYGLIAALIAVAIIASVTNLGTSLSSTFSMLASHFGATVQ